MTFTQTLTVQAESPQALADLLEGWLELDFSDEAQARRNNARAETRAWAENLAQVVDKAPEYRNYEVAYRAR